jgi:hypothetical protein
MVKRLLLIAVVGLFFSNVNAQITINASDFQSIFAVGKQFLSHIDTLTNSVNIGSKGNFGTLDFSGLNNSTSYLTISQDVATSPYSADYPQAQYVLKNNENYEGNTAEVWLYYSFTNESYLFYGSATEASYAGMGMVMKLKFDPVYKTSQFPLNYNSTFSTSTTGITEMSITGLPIPPTTTTNNFSINQVADGYGKIITPEGKTLSCLRVKEETTETSEYGTATTTEYTFITKTGESISISAKPSQPDNGVIQTDGISWAEGFGTSEPSDVEKTNELPKSFSLSQNYPNPFNPSTKISFSLPQRSSVALRVYDVLGNEVAELANGEFEPGVYNAEFDASKLSSGIYFYTLRTNNFIESKKMLLVK